MIPVYAVSAFLVEFIMATGMAIVLRCIFNDEDDAMTPGWAAFLGIIWPFTLSFAAVILAVGGLGIGIGYVAVKGPGFLVKKWLGLIGRFGREVKTETLVEHNEKRIAAIRESMEDHHLTEEVR